MKARFLNILTALALVALAPPPTLAAKGCACGSGQASAILSGECAAILSPEERHFLAYLEQRQESNSDLGTARCGVADLRQVPLKQGGSEDLYARYHQGKTGNF